jgi:hypothetical protein
MWRVVVKMQKERFVFFFDLSYRLARNHITVIETVFLGVYSARAAIYSLTVAVGRVTKGSANFIQNTLARKMNHLSVSIKASSGEITSIRKPGAPTPWDIKRS